jgi:hypothetical protein
LSATGRGTATRTASRTRSWRTTTPSRCPFTARPASSTTGPAATGEGTNRICFDPQIGFVLNLNSDWFRPFAAGGWRATPAPPAWTPGTSRRSAPARST